MRFAFSRLMRTLLNWTFLLSFAALVPSHAEASRATAKRGAVVKRVKKAFRTSFNRFSRRRNANAQHTRLALRIGEGARPVRYLLRMNKKTGALSVFNPIGAGGWLGSAKDLHLRGSFAVKNEKYKGVFTISITEAESILLAFDFDTFQPVMMAAPGSKGSLTLDVGETDADGITMGSEIEGAYAGYPIEIQQY